MTLSLSEVIDDARDEVLAKNPTTYDQLYDVTRATLGAYDLSDQEFDAAMDIIITNYDL